MKKFLICAAMSLSLVFAKAQVLSVAGGNFTQDNVNKAFVDAEVSANVATNWSAHLSYATILGGRDMATFGVRFAPWKVVGVRLSACYLPKQDIHYLYGVDLGVSEKVRLVFNSSFDGNLRTIGVRVPVFNF